MIVLGFCRRAGYSLRVFFCADSLSGSVVFARGGVFLRKSGRAEGDREERGGGVSFCEGCEDGGGGEDPGGERANGRVQRAWSGADGREMEEGGLGCCADFDGDALTGTGAWSGEDGRKMGQGEQGLNGLWRRMHFDYGKLRVSTTEWQWTVEAGESNGMAIDGQKRAEQGDRVRFGGATLPGAEFGLPHGG